MESQFPFDKATHVRCNIFPRNSISHSSKLILFSEFLLLWKMRRFCQDCSDFHDFKALGNQTQYTKLNSKVGRKNIVYIW